jgi:hypothetical protein
MLLTLQDNPGELKFISRARCGGAMEETGNDAPILNAPHEFLSGPFPE